MSHVSWGAISDRVLARLFKVGEPAPTRKQLIDAYPFGPREMWPYKAWLGRVKAWKAAWAKGLARPEARRSHVVNDPAQEKLL